MTDKKIGNFEAIALILTVIVNHVFLNLPKNIIASTSSASIINVIYISLIAVLIGYLICKLLEKFPRLDILDIANFLGGKWLKITTGILFLSYFLFSVSTVLRSFSEGLKIIFFPRTPIAAIMILFLLTIVITNKIGSQAIIRSNLFMMPVFLFSIFFIFFANIGNFTIQRMLPILGNGAFTTFFSGLSNLFAFGGFAYLYLLPPYLKDDKGLKKITFISIIASGICLLFSVATLLFLSPNSVITEEISPLYLASRNIEFGRFLQRLDAVFLLFWIISLTAYLSISFAFATRVFQKLLNLEYTKWYTGLFALFIFGFALIPKNMYQLLFIEGTIYQYVVLILIFGISLALLILANIKYYILEKKKGAVLIDKAPI